VIPPVTTDRRWRIAAALGLGALAVVMIATARDYGLTWDEEFHRIYGDYVIAWFTSGFRDRSALQFANLYLYGGFFDVLAQLFARLSPGGVYEDRHLVNIVFGLIACAGAFRLAARIAGPRAGFLALALCATTPMFYGHAFNNPKDIPFAAMFIWTLALIVESAGALPRLDRRAIAKLAVAAGLTLGIRSGGVFILGYIGLFWAVALFLHARHARPPREELKRQIRDAALAFAAVLAVAWVLMIAFWPYAQVNPIENPIIAIRNARRFDFADDNLFNGSMVNAQRTPASYIPTWFAIQLPETYFVCWIAGLSVFLLRKLSLVPKPPCLPTRTHLPLPLHLHLPTLSFLLFAALFPVAAAILLRSTLYDAVRHFLFIIPPLAVLSALALDAALDLPVLRRPAMIAALLAAGLTMREMVALHPYETVFFNRIIGGLPGANGRFETDYWGNSYRAATEWVIANVPGDHLRVANCSYPLLSSYFLQGEAAKRIVPVQGNSDILLATTRWNCHKKHPNARVLHTVERRGVPLAYVLDLRETGKPSK
jgi:hypothetical protein